MKKVKSFNKKKKKVKYQPEKIETINYPNCPVQTNGYDCGVFTSYIMKNIIEEKEITPETLQQCDTSIARKVMMYQVLTGTTDEELIKLKE